MIDSKLPLLDLHRHLDGNIRPATIWQLAEKNSIALPTAQFKEFIPYVQIQDSEADLLAFLKKLDWGVSVLKNLDDVKRVAYENVEDAFNAGLHYAELRFSPYYMAMNHHLLITDVVSAVIDGVQAGIKSFNIKINLIGILSRTFGVKQCQLELESLLKHKDKLVAIDLAGDEYNFPGELFIEHFNQVRDAGLQVTIHAGEAGGAKSVWQAITELGATRIGHGVATINDEKLMTYMVNNNIAIESCLTSNFQTGTVKNLSKHPLKTFLKVGIKACLNTDDPAVQGIEAKHEFEVAQQKLKFTDSEISQLQKNAVEVSFLSSTEKTTLLSRNKIV
ncbi:adenosine deaminase [Candidatus Colwellia aromaticivorans]|uniref:adenosine deaminase n=1 Tax=Candidatus Colwellia aromaticivorans TaxID=2267621 RepID=UPI000DF37DCE|nr:adenosine deaminase [Candidatus Colwellia aromaticivorans]